MRVDMKNLKFFILVIGVSSAFTIPSKLPHISRHKYYINYPHHKNLIMQKKENKNKVISFEKDKGILLYNIPATPEIWTIALVYFIQGLFNICRLALSFYYKDTLHLTPFDLTIISSISTIPWVIKPLYGFISDTFPLFGYKRKSYLIFSGLLGSISWAVLGNIATLINNGQILGDTISTYSSVFLVTLSSLGLAFSDVIVDAIVVSKSRDQDKAGSLQSICWTASSIGGIISAYFSGYLLQNYGTTFVFYLTSVIPLTILGTAGLIKENKTYQSDVYNHKEIYTLLKEKSKNIWEILLKESILYPFLFLIIWNITPSAGMAFFYYQVNELGFQPEFFGKLKLLGSLASLLGIVIYNKYLKDISLRDIFKWSSIYGTLLGFFPLMLVTHFNRSVGLPDGVFAMIDSVILSIFGQITFMPILILAAKICPPGVEGMLYATIMSANNLSTTVSSLLGGFMTEIMGITNKDFTNLPLLMVITNLSGLIPLMFLNLVPSEKNEEK